MLQQIADALFPAEQLLIVRLLVKRVGAASEAIQAPLRPPGLQTAA